MRILHVFDHSAPLHSGYSFRSLAILREQRKLGFETFHVTSPKQGSFADVEEEAAGFFFHRTPVGTSRADSVPILHELRLMDRLAGRIAEVVRKVRPDVIHAHSPLLNALPAQRVGRQMRIPVIYEVRSLWEDSAVEQGKTSEGSPRYRASRALETYALRRAEHVVTICEGLKQEIASRRVPLERITVVPNGVDVDRFVLLGGRDPTLNARLGLDGKLVIGFAGSFSEYEGLDLLVQAFERISKQRADTLLLLIGGGPEDQPLRRQVAEAGLGERVLFTGRVPHETIDAYYSLFDLLVYPRRSGRLTEIVTPLKPLEAMAQGLPLVASDIGGHRELIRDNVTGFLFPPHDPEALASRIEQVLADPRMRSRVTAQAREFVVRERTWAAGVANTALVYRAASEALQPVAARAGRRPQGIG